MYFKIGPNRLFDPSLITYLTSFFSDKGNEAEKRRDRFGRRPGSEDWGGSGQCKSEGGGFVVVIAIVIVVIVGTEDFQSEIHPYRGVAETTAIKF